MRTYEGMFLLDAGSPSFDEAVAPVRTVFERSEAEVLQLRKWDERRLAYEIKGRRRGLYVLTYFKADPARIAEIERDAKLNEKILRVLILAIERADEEKMAAPTPAEREAARREVATEGDKTDATEKTTEASDGANKEASEPAEAPKDDAAADAPPAEVAETTEEAEKTEQAGEAEKAEKAEKADAAKSAE